MKKTFLPIIFFLLFLVTGCQLINPDVSQHYTGSVEGNVISIKSKVSGEIINKNIGDGSFVKKGDILYKIDDSDLKFELSKLKLEKEIAELTYSDLKNGVNENQLNTALNQLKLVKEEIKSAKLNYNFLLNKHNNNSKLYNEGALSEDSLDSSKYSLDQSKNKISLLEKKRQQAISSYKELETATSIETIETAKKRIEIVDTKIKQLNNRLNDYTITAPINGKFEKTYYEEGEIVSTLSDFGKLINPDDIWLNVYIPEKLLSEVEIGKKYKLVDDFISKDAYGEVIYISDSAEFTPKNVESKESKQSMVFKIQVKLHNTKKVKPGMFLTLDFSSDINE